jgi:hypothetical protein
VAVSGVNATTCAPAASFLPAYVAMPASRYSAAPLWPITLTVSPTAKSPLSADARSMTISFAAAGAAPSTSAIGLMRSSLCHAIPIGIARLRLLSSSSPSWPTTNATPSTCGSAAATPGTPRTWSRSAASMEPRVVVLSASTVEAERTTASVSLYTWPARSS